jgi:hypothetical protein
MNRCYGIEVRFDSNENRIPKKEQVIFSRVRTLDGKRLTKEQQAIAKKAGKETGIHYSATGHQGTTRKIAEALAITDSGCPCYVEKFIGFYL